MARSGLAGSAQATAPAGGERPTQAAGADRREPGLVLRLRVRRCANGQQLKCLTVTDEWTREGLAIEVDGRIRSKRVIEVLAGSSASAAETLRIEDHKVAAFQARQSRPGCIGNTRNFNADWKDSGEFDLRVADVSRNTSSWKFEDLLENKPTDLLLHLGGKHGWGSRQEQRRSLLSLVPAGSRVWQQRRKSSSHTHPPGSDSWPAPRPRSWMIGANTYSAVVT
jgi:hypothetical protein